MNAETSDDALYDFLDFAIDEAAKAITFTERDDLCRELPEWIPAKSAQEFSQARGRLLAHYTDSQIIEWMDAHDANTKQVDEHLQQANADINADVTNMYARQITIPPNVKYDISTLALIRRAGLLNQSKGLPMLIGKEEADKLDIAQRVANGYKTRENQTHKKEFQSLAQEYKADFSNLAELKKISAFGFYFKHYGKGHTLRDWINEVMPGQLKRGPTKKIK